MSFTRVRPDVATEPSSAPITRPPLWAEGRQRPAFAIGPYLTVSVAMAKRDLGPEMADAAGRLTDFGGQIAAGNYRLSLHWMGRIARFVPSCHRVGGAVLAIAGLFEDARLVLGPAPRPDEPIAYPDLVRPGRHARCAVISPAQAQPRPVEPTLQAIRSAIGGPTVGAASERPAVQALSEDPTERHRTADARSGLRLGLRRTTCWGLIGVLMPFAVPAGLVRAMMFHLNGGDLRDWS